jgi:hypothetical protein
MEYMHVRKIWAVWFILSITKPWVVEYMQITPQGHGVYAGQSKGYGVHAGHQSGYGNLVIWQTLGVFQNVLTTVQ